MYSRCFLMRSLYSKRAFNQHTSNQHKLVLDRDQHVTGVSQTQSGGVGLADLLWPGLRSSQKSREDKFSRKIKGRFWNMVQQLSASIMVWIYTIVSLHKNKKMKKDSAKSFFTITAEIHARSLANFYGQYADRHMNLKFMRRVSVRELEIWQFGIVKNKLMSVFKAPVLLLTMNFIITSSK